MPVFKEKLPYFWSSFELINSLFEQKRPLKKSSVGIREVKKTKCPPRSRQEKCIVSINAFSNRVESVRRTEKRARRKGDFGRDPPHVHGGHVASSPDGRKSMAVAPVSPWPFRFRFSPVLFCYIFFAPFSASRRHPDGLRSSGCPRGAATGAQSKCKKNSVTLGNTR